MKAEGENYVRIERDLERERESVKQDDEWLIEKRKKIGLIFHFHMILPNQSL